MHGENSQCFVSCDMGHGYCALLLQDATIFENGNPTTGVKSVLHLARTESVTPVQPAVTHSWTQIYLASIHLRVVQDTRAVRWILKAKSPSWPLFRVVMDHVQAYFLKGVLRSQHSEVVQCEVVCENHIVQLLLALVFAKHRPLTLLLGVAIFNISGV
jgi:hypothetical protein